MRARQKQRVATVSKGAIETLDGWLVGCFGFNGPFRQYFSLYRAVSQREGEKGEKMTDESKNSKQPPPVPTTSAVGPCPTVIQIVKHWSKKYMYYVYDDDSMYKCAFFSRLSCTDKTVVP